MKYSEILKEARRLHSLGFACIWLHARSKRPVESRWTSGERKSLAELEQSYQAGFNLGVRLGSPSRLAEGYLMVVDVDIRSAEPKHMEEAQASLRALLGVLGAYPSVSSGRKGGSAHYYAISREPFKTFNPASSSELVKVHMPSKKPTKVDARQLSKEEIEKGLRMSRAWEISLYSEGRQVVLPPSVHPDSGELYQWLRILKSAEELPLLELKGIQKAVEEFEHSEIEGSSNERAVSASLSNFKIEPVELSWLPVSEAVKNALLVGEGVTDRSGYLLRASQALLSAGLSQNEVLTVLTDPETFLGAVGYEHAQTLDRARAAEWVYRYTLARVQTERDASAIFPPLSEMPKPRKLSAEEMQALAEEFRETDWRSRLDREAKGRVKMTLKNLDLIFTNEVEGAAFIEDLFASRIEYGADTPWGGRAGEYIKDIDLILVKRWLADTEFGIEPGREAILEATSLLAHRCRIHPVREYLSGLKWDGVSRINSWIKHYCQGKALEPYLSEISRKFLLAMVKRVFEPGCQWDYVLVLEGKQGRYKSSIARALAGDKWFMDNLPDLKDKDSMLNLQGKWLIELGELADVKRADYNLVKAYLVRRTDTVRPHYGRLQSDVPRQSVFIGTINEGQYLKDPTGNRRYWPVKVGTCDVAGLKAVRDQLFAEAVHIYKTENEVLMLSEVANRQAGKAQDERRVDDDETEMREELLDFATTETGRAFNFDEFRARDLMTGINAPWGQWKGKNYSMNTAAQVLNTLGFSRKKIHGQRIWRITETAKKNLFNKSGISSGQPRGQPKIKVAFAAPELEDRLDFN